MRQTELTVPFSGGRGKPTATAFLRAVDPAKPGPREFQLLKDEITIGADNQSDFVITDPTVSRRHAKISRRNGHYELTDLSSTNGSFVNEKRVVAPQVLRGGDVLRFGNTQFTFALPAPAVLRAKRSWLERARSLRWPRVSRARVIAALVVAVLLAVGVIWADIWVHRTLLSWRIDRLVRAKHYTEAIALLEERLRQAPRDAYAEALLGGCYLTEGEQARAQEAFESAAAIDPGRKRQIGEIYLDRGKAAFQTADLESAQGLFAAATSFDPSLRPEVAKVFFKQGNAAFKLRDLASAEKLFDSATQYDAGLKRKVASYFARVATGLVSNDLDGAERYAKLAASYDANAAREYGDEFFKTLDVCNLRTIGKEPFMARIALCDVLGLSEATKESANYRLAYAASLYETGPRQQALDLLTSLTRSDPHYCVAVEANRMMAPPPVGQQQITGPPVAVGGTLTARLLYADVTKEAITLVFSFQAGDADTYMLFLAPGRNSAQSPYILDDNGKVNSATSGWVGGRETDPLNQDLRRVPFKAGEQQQLKISFPLITPGAHSFKFVSPGMNWGWGNAAPQWSWPEVKIKRGFFD